MSSTTDNDLIERYLLGKLTDKEIRGLRTGLAMIGSLRAN